MSGLALAGVTVRYGALTAVADVDLGVGTAETVSLLGANGAGKSTLLKAVAGLVPLAAGRMGFDGRDLPSRRPRLRTARGIAYVPEGRRVFPGMTVADNLEVAGRGDRRRRRELIGRVYDLFPRLAERARSLGWQLSGGEQQMLAIGRALMSEPRLLLLDEPSLGLSPRLLDDLFAQVGRIAKAGTAVLVAEQRVDYALEIADRAAVLRLGRLVEEAPAGELAARGDLLDTYLGA